jgi:hypothetical protein
MPGTIVREAVQDLSVCAAGIAPIPPLFQVFQEGLHMEHAILLFSEKAALLAGPEPNLEFPYVFTERFRGSGKAISL